MSRYPFPIPFGWFQVCWPDDVPVAGSYMTHNVGRDLAVTRTDGGFEVRDHEGSRRYPTVERNGVVLFWYHPHDEPPSFEVPALDAFAGSTEWSKPLRHHHPRIDVLWQELGETAADVAHIQTHLVEYGVEMGTDGVVAGRPTVLETSWVGPHGYMRLSQPFPTPRGPVDGRIDTDSFGPGVSLTMFTGLLDTALLGCNTPIDEESTELRFTFVCRRAGDDASTEALSRAYMEEIHRLAVDDVEIWENKAYLESPCLADTDGPIMKYRRWAAQFYLDSAS